MKKYNYLKKSQKLLLATMTIPLVVSVLPSIENVYANNSTPVLRVYEVNGSPKLEWATEILAENVLWKSSFENNEIIPNYDSLNNSSGKQSLKNENGNNFMSLNDNITNREGNLYSFPATDSEISAMYFPRLYIANKTNLSVSFKARNISSTINSISVNTGDNHGLKGVEYNYDNKYIVFDENVDFNNAPDTLKIRYEDGSEINNLANNSLFRITTSKQGDHNYGIIFYFWDSNEKVLRKSTSSFSTPSGNSSGKKPYNETFNKNDRVLVLENIHKTFPERSITKSNEWEIYNLNTLLDSNNFDYLVGGFNFAIYWTANGEIQFDEVTFGYATEVEVYRDGQSIYKGYLSDFHDTSIRDTVKPNKVTNVATSIGNNFNVQFNITKPQDNGVKTNYQIQSIAKNGNRSTLSNTQEIEIKSGIVKYKYSISSQENSVPTVETNSLNDMAIPLKSVNLATDYLHIQAIDANGNVSDVESFQLKDLIDMKDLYNKIKELEESNSYDDFIDFIEEVEGLYGDNLPQDLKELIDRLGQHHGVNTSFLLLEEGDFRLSISDIESFGITKLTAKKQTLTTAFKGDFGVIDARGTQEGWHVSVSATPFMVETFDGFVGIPHQLPVGSFALNAITNVEQVGTIHNSQLPDITLNSLTTIDGQNTVINVLNADKGKGMGEFKFNFTTDALALTVDAVTAKIDNVNYPDQNTPYASTVTWDLVSGPQI